MRLSRRQVWAGLLATLLAVPLGGVAAVLTATASGAAVTNFTDATILGPSGIAVGPDGALWFTNAGNASIGQITTTGLVANFTDPSIAQPSGIAAGIDTNMWFTNEANNSIGQISSDGGGTVVRFVDPSISSPTGIAAGPDGNLWFTNAGNSSIGQITTDGSGTISNFTDPSISSPTGITAGPDGNLWFTNAGNGSIGRITTAGVVTKFTDASISSPRGITSGPDGSMWFTNAGNSSIGRITTTGTVTKITAPSISSPRGIVTGPDHAVWFTNAGNSSIGRVTVQVPGVPTSASAIPYGNAAALVGWGAPPSNGSPITGYVIRPYLAGVAQPARVFNSTATFEVVKFLKNGKSYQFTVAAQNAGGTGAPSPKTAPIIAGAPGPPKNVTAVKVASGSLKVSFTAPPGNGAAITGYTVLCASSNGGVAKSKTGTASPITDSGLTAGKTYVCNVKATNSRGTGPASAVTAPVTV